VTTVIGRVDIDIAGEETSSDDTGVGEVGAGETSTASGRRGLVRVPARALAARWQGLNPRRAIVLAVVVGFVALTLAVPIRTYFSQRAELDQIRASNAAIEQESAELTRKVNEQGDPAYVEAQARARLQYVRPGETPFVLEIPGRERTAQEERRAAERAANPWFANLWDSVATPPPAK
jgi:cell division protein FtsB